MATRDQNEHRFGNWEELPAGGRRYWFDVPGRHRGVARYVKFVDSDERTLRFVQEIYGDDGVLVAVHEKYPVDRGHQVADR